MNVLALLSIPMIGLFILGNMLSVVWFDVIYAVGIGFALPAWLFDALS